MLPILSASNANILKQQNPRRRNAGNSVLNNTKGRVLQDANATYKLSTLAFAKLLGKKATFGELLQSGEIKVDGNPKALGAILANLENFNPLFNIVTP